MTDISRLKKLAKLVSDYSDCSCQGRDDDENPDHDGMACYDLDDIKLNDWCIGCLAGELGSEARKRT